MSSFSVPPMAAGQRHFPRARLNLPARLVTFTGTTPCTVVDVSQSGAKLGASEPPRVGAMVVVEGLPTELFGTVQWAGAGLFGVHFDVPLARDRVVALRRLADTAPSREQEVAAFAQKWVQGLV
jgi:hypothetical protein